MKERLEKLKALLEEIKSNCYADQYHVADFGTEGEMNKLIKERDFYDDTLSELDKIKS